MRGIGRIDQNGDPAQCRNGLLDQFDPLGACLNEEEGQAGDIPSGPAHAGDQAVLDRVLADIQVPDSTIFAGVRSLGGRLRVLTASMYALFERTQHWFELLAAELTEVPVLAHAEAAFWNSIQQLYEQALAGSDDEVLARTMAGLLHPATFGALKVTGMTVDEATAVVAELLIHQARGGR